MKEFIGRISVGVGLRPDPNRGIIGVKTKLDPYAICARDQTQKVMDLFQKDAVSQGG